jgi:hypothetical protein
LSTQHGTADYVQSIHLLASAAARPKPVFIHQWLKAMLPDSSRVEEIWLSGAVEESEKTIVSTIAAEAFDYD